jgi:drug/metabolite transporter (DMT)-like permease
MIWMLLCILSGAAFGHIMRNAQVRHCAMPWVGALNYALAAVACWAWLVLSPSGSLTLKAALLGSFAGACLVAAYFLMNVAFRAAGVGITMSVQWLGVVVPVAASILIWREIPGWVQAVGLGLAVIAFPLLASGNNGSAAQGSRWKILILASLFLLEGAICLSMKIYSKLAPPGTEAPFLCFQFSAAAVGNILAAARTNRPGLADLVHGFGMGASNLLCNFTFLRAVTLLPGTVVFPTTSAGSVVVTAIVGMILWRERYRGLALIGLILATIALVLINIHVKPVQ